MSRPLRIFTWHIHGSYLYYLSRAGHELYVPVNDTRSEGYAGRTKSYPWPDNVIEVHEQQISGLALDCILYQSKHNHAVDQFLVLSDKQRKLPKIYLEHDPPRQHPTDTKHPVQSADVLVVHVTAFNQLMWDVGNASSCVVEHGVVIPEGVHYSGTRARGATAVNNLRSRGRRLGLDVWEEAAREIPLDLYGMGYREVRGGVREASHAELPAVLAEYRFFFNPIRYTSFGLALCEAMMVGMPVVALATTEIPTVIPNGVAGYIDTSPQQLIPRMRELLENPDLAHQLGRQAKSIAEKRFGIVRFAADWDSVFRFACGERRGQPHEMLKNFNPQHP